MSSCIESVKNNARRFHLEFASAMTDLGSEIDSMRIRVVVFRDYKDEGKDAVVASEFFELPMDEPDFASYMSGVTAFGGGDYPENGLEALYTAMNSDFTTGAKDRQVIVLFTDAEALALKERAGEAGYPADMVDEDGLVTTWACASQEKASKLREKNKRLVIFAPAGTKYEELSKKLNRSIFEPVDMGAGLKDIDFKEIIKIIAASASAV